MLGLRFRPESVLSTQSVILSPRFTPESMFYTQSVVRIVHSPQSMFYTDRVPNLTLNLGRLGNEFDKKKWWLSLGFPMLDPCSRK